MGCTGSDIRQTASSFLPKASAILQELFRFIRARMPKNQPAAGRSSQWARLRVQNSHPEWEGSGLDSAAQRRLPPSLTTRFPHFRTDFVLVLVLVLEISG
jgi:hypothetical protein